MQEATPQNRFELKYSKFAPDVISRLQSLKRTGWVNRGVRNPESVQEHTVALRDLVISEMVALNDFSSTDKEDILDMLEIHDWAESDPSVGDMVILKNDLNKEALRKEKYELELGVMKKICSKLGEAGKRILELWLRFENGEDPVSSFAKQVDKYQAFEKAFEYEQSGENVSTQEFIDSTDMGIVHPVLVTRLEELKTKLLNFRSNIK